MSRWQTYHEKLETGGLKVSINQWQPHPSWVILNFDGTEIQINADDFVIFVEWLNTLRKYKTRTNQEIEDTWK